MTQVILHDVMSPVTHARSEAEQFDTWWALYPRKVAKLAARRAWRAAVRRIAFETKCSHEQAGEQLIAALARFHFNPDPRYQPHPATWLNAGRYLDEQPAAPSIQSSVLRAVGL